MNSEDRQLLIETHSKSSTTAKLLEEFIAWSKELHAQRDRDICDLKKDVANHGFYIRLLQWVGGLGIPLVSLAATAFFKWFVTHGGHTHG